jgi:hypothetical protein
MVRIFKKRRTAGKCPSLGKVKPVAGIFTGTNDKNAACEPTRPKPAIQFISDSKYQAAICELVDALELCLKCDGLSWEAEREADILVSRYRKIGRTKNKWKTN